ncbi:C4-dicarboxylate TRAP transporter substrate-binding protein [Pelagibacterium lentulum]|uniref:C4-dicarboxylate ABC transporter n=1 Tax=Pelagibacterium lentulum TaxID=2029865 RepID=A0A916RKF4_9HYPH|nr:C4-dicarboxylate TRAP transporter substrate-binding protein [Pelagibacterium lentulum]GGA59418.1 C4-dicarboxylate ABC transporter [Pelagibacterium lentulum]
MNKLTTGLLAAVMLSVSPLAVQAQDVTIRVAYENNPGEPTDLVMQYWQELIAERSNGEIALELYPSSQLGSKTDITDQAIMGLNVITITDVGFLAEYEPDLGILYGPYLTDDPQKLFDIYDGEWFTEMSEKLRTEHGVRIVLPNLLYGVRHLISTRPVRSPEDMQGLKVRVPNNIMQIRAIEAMGAVATPMPLGDVYTALAQGVIDAVENPIAVLYGQRFHEEADHLSLIGYLTNTAMFVGGEAFFSTLSDEHMQIVEETAYEAGLYSQELITNLDNEMLEEMVAAGVEVIEVDIAPFQELTRSVYEGFPEWSEGLYEMIQAQLQ